jgi:hypothetical protein
MVLTPLQQRLVAYETWLSAATLVFAVWLALLFLDASVVPVPSSGVVPLGLPASVVLFGVGFGLFVRRQNRS